MYNKTLIALTLSAFSLLSQAAPLEQVWNNPECATGACEIKSMKLTVKKYYKDNLAGNEMGAEIEGVNKEVLSKYAFVQYLKGCVFQINSKGEKKLAYREYLGKNNQPFKHLNWAVDSGSDNDPLYQSFPNAGYDELRGFVIPRNAYYENKNPITSESGNRWGGKVKNLVENKLFAHDLPSMSQFAMNTDFTWTAQNSNLQFKICLHKIEDVAKNSDDPGYVAPNPINCMEWSSNYGYDPLKHKIVERAAIHPFCLE